MISLTNREKEVLIKELQCVLKSFCIDGYNDLKELEELPVSSFDKTEDNDIPEIKNIIRKVREDEMGLKRVCCGVVSKKDSFISCFRIFAKKRV